MRRDVETVQRLLLPTGTGCFAHPVPHAVAGFISFAARRGGRAYFCARMSPATLTSLLKNAAGQVLADPTGFLRLHWSASPRALPDTQAMFVTAARALRQYGWGRILINQVQMAPFTPQEQRWISQEWLPGAVHESGYRAGAVVVATNVLTRLATAYITTNSPEPLLRYRSFDLEAVAIEWLLMQPA